MQSKDIHRFVASEETLVVINPTKNNQDIKLSNFPKVTLYS